MSKHNAIIKKFDLYIVNDSGDDMNEHVGYNAKLLHIIKTNGYIILMLI